MIAFA